MLAFWYKAAADPRESNIPDPRLFDFGNGCDHDEAVWQLVYSRGGPLRLRISLKRNDDRIPHSQNFVSGSLGGGVNTLFFERRNAEAEFRNSDQTAWKNDYAPIREWIHIAVAFSSSSGLRLFVDGLLFSQQGVQQRGLMLDMKTKDSYLLVNNQLTMGVGVQASRGDASGFICDDRSVDAHIDEFRILTGTVEREHVARLFRTLDVPTFAAFALPSGESDCRKSGESNAMQQTGEFSFSIGDSTILCVSIVTREHGQSNGNVARVSVDVVRTDNTSLPTSQSSATMSSNGIRVQTFGWSTLANGNYQIQARISDPFVGFALSPPIALSVNKREATIPPAAKMTPQQSVTPFAGLPSQTITLFDRASSALRGKDPVSDTSASSGFDVVFAPESHANPSSQMNKIMENGGEDDINLLPVILGIAVGVTFCGLILALLFFFSSSKKKSTKDQKQSDTTNGVVAASQRESDSLYGSLEIARDRSSYQTVQERTSTLPLGSEGQTNYQPLQQTKSGVVGTYESFDQPSEMRGSYRKYKFAL